MELRGDPPRSSRRGARRTEPEISNEHTEPDFTLDTLVRNFVALAETLRGGGIHLLPDQGIVVANRAGISLLLQLTGVIHR